MNQLSHGPDEFRRISELNKRLLRFVKSVSISCLGCEGMMKNQSHSDHCTGRAALVAEAEKTMKEIGGEEWCVRRLR